jgi:hypothetical protein
MKRLLVVAASAVVLGCSSSATLVIANESNATLRDVVASGSAFSESIGTIPPHSTRQVAIHPRGESELRLTFTADGQRVTFGPEGYFEGTGGYRVTATVSPQFSVSLKSEITGALISGRHRIIDGANGGHHQNSDEISLSLTFTDDVPRRRSWFR